VQHAYKTTIEGHATALKGPTATFTVEGKVYLKKLKKGLVLVRQTATSLSKPDNEHTRAHQFMMYQPF
jgi:hypothetical protein